MKTVQALVFVTDGASQANDLNFLTYATNTLKLVLFFVLNVAQYMIMATGEFDRPFFIRCDFHRVDETSLTKSNMTIIVVEVCWRRGRAAHATELRLIDQIRIRRGKNASLKGMV